MSSNPNANVPPAKGPINIFWIETLRLDIPYDIVRSDTGVVFQSALYRFPLQRDDLFCFKVTKVGLNDILINCMRGSGVYDDEDIDTGYALRFYFSIAGIEEPPKHADMPQNLEETSVILKTEYLAKKLFQGYNNYLWQLKVVVKMLEYENLPNDHIGKTKHDGLFRAFKDGFMRTEEKVRDMSFLLTRTSLNDVFSGRQDDLFVIMKLTYITRASFYSRELVEYFKMKKRMMMTNTLPEKPCELDLSVVLNFIHKMEKTPITNEDLLELFLRAYRFGMNFLKVIITFYVVDNLMNSDFVIDALKVADIVDDSILIDKAMDVFIPNMMRLFRGQKWMDFADGNNGVARSVLSTLTYRAVYQELRVPAKILDYMEECSEV